MSKLCMCYLCRSLRCLALACQRAEQEPALLQARLDAAVLAQRMVQDLADGIKCPNRALDQSLAEVATPGT